MSEVDELPEEERTRWTKVAESRGYVGSDGWHMEGRDQPVDVIPNSLFVIFVQIFHALRSSGSANDCCPTELGSIADSVTSHEFPMSNVYCCTPPVV